MIRRLEAGDAAAFVSLRREALEESPLSFASSPDDDRFGTPEAVIDLLARAPDAVIFGAFRPHLVGSVGIYREPHTKASHKAHIWGMYVAPGSRRDGLGTTLLAAAVDHARSLPGVAWVHLGVSSAAPAAQELYERAGFRVWGSEPEALRLDGESATEHHLALRL